MAEEYRLVGYARVSTDDQRLDLQMDALAKAGVPEDSIYTDYASGIAPKRKGFEMCMKALREGDVLVVWKLDRLARSVTQLITVMEMLRTKEIELRVITQNIDTTSAFGKFIFHIFAALAEMERELISERTKAGIAAARRRGRHPGRPAAMSHEQWHEAAKRLLAGEAGYKVAESLGLKRSTVYSYREDLLAGRPYPFDKKEDRRNDSANHHMQHLPVRDKS